MATSHEPSMSLNLWHHQGMDVTLQSRTIAIEEQTLASSTMRVKILMWPWRKMSAVLSKYQFS